MVVADFSEFTYGFGLVSELIDEHGDRVVPPLFPTTNTETAAGGFDVRVELVVPMFIQFKRPDHLVGPRARERDTFRGRPYYRIYLRTGYRGQPDQHGALLELHSRFPGQVHYFAPRFHTSEAMHDAYRTQTIAQRSLDIPPAEVGPRDASRHVVVYGYTDADPVDVLSNEPRRIVGKAASLAIDTWLQDERIIELKSLLGELRAFLARFGERGHVPQEGPPSARLRATADVLRYSLDTELLLARPPGGP